MWLRDQTLNSLFCPHHCTQEYCCCLVTVLFHFLIILSALSHELSLSGRRCDPLGKEQIVCFCDVLQCDVNLIWLFLNSNLRTCCKKPSKLCVCVCVYMYILLDEKCISFFLLRCAVLRLQTSNGWKPTLLKQHHAFVLTCLWLLQSSASQPPTHIPCGDSHLSPLTPEMPPWPNRQLFVLGRIKAS